MLERLTKLTEKGVLGNRQELKGRQLSCVVGRDVIAKAVDRGNSDKKRVAYVDYYKEVSIFERIIDGVKSPERKSYIISAIDERDKDMPAFSDCYGLIAVGSRRDGRNLSFGVHRNTSKYLNNNLRESFRSDLSLQLRHLISKVEKNTVEVVIFGSRLYNVSKNSPNKIVYVNDIKQMAITIKNIAGIEPFVVGPNIGLIVDEIGLEMGRTDTYFRNATRELLIERKAERFAIVNGETIDMNAMYKISNFPLLQKSGIDN